MTNEERAVHGLNAVTWGTPDFDENDYRTNVVDTLANIMHSCERAGIDFDDALDSARMHFNAEINPDELEQGGEQ